MINMVITTFIKEIWRIITIILILLSFSCNLNEPEDANLIDVNFQVVETKDGKQRYNVIFYKGKKEVARKVIENGRLISSKGEIPDGYVIEKYDSGNLKNIIMYKHGKRNGKALGFYESGKIKVETNYINGNPSGKIRMFYENGNIKMESEIQEGKEIYHVEYDEFGNIIYKNKGGSGVGAVQIPQTKGERP